MQKVVVASATDISVRAVNHQNPNKIGMFGFTVPTYAAILCFMYFKSFEMTSITSVLVKPMHPVHGTRAALIRSG
jgi:hypothetical protein